MVATLMRQHAQEMQRPHMGGIELQYFLVQAGGILQPTLLMQLDGVVEQALQHLGERGGRGEREEDGEADARHDGACITGARRRQPSAGAGGSSRRFSGQRSWAVSQASTSASGIWG